MAKQRKTISVEQFVNKANFDILIGTYVHGNKTIARHKWDFAHSTLSTFGVYNGFNMFHNVHNVENILRTYPQTIYNESEIQQVLTAYKVCEARIGDIWYNETGHTLSDVFNETHENGWIKNHELFTEWLRFSAKYFEEENWIYLH